MRGKQHRYALLGDRLHEGLMELAPGEWVEAGHRLIENKQIGALRDGKSESQLGALPP
jgi:hypothetical protein